MHTHTLPLKARDSWVARLESVLGDAAASSTARNRWEQLLIPVEYRRCWISAERAAFLLNVTDERFAAMHNDGLLEGLDAASETEDEDA